MAGLVAYLVFSAALAVGGFPLAGLPRLRFGVALLGDAMFLAGVAAYTLLSAFVPDSGPSTTSRWIAVAAILVPALALSALVARAQYQAMRRSIATL